MLFLDVRFFFRKLKKIFPIIKIQKDANLNFDLFLYVQIYLNFPTEQTEGDVQ